MPGLFPGVQWLRHASDLSAPRCELIQLAIQYDDSFLAGGGLSGAGGRSYCLCGEVATGWVFICSELRCDKASRTYGGEKTLNQTGRCCCTSDSLLVYRLKNPPDKKHALQ